jgi:SAM-dependent methyltransferase
MKPKIVSSQRFHQLSLKNAVQNFESFESTACYMLREKSDFLNRRSYGEAVYECMAAELGKPPKSVVEIGAGTGHLALSFLQKQRKSKTPFQYSIFDLSPVLIRAQKKTLHSFRHSVRWTQGPAAKTLRKIKYTSDLIIANEMLADLDVLVVQKKSKAKLNLPSHLEKIVRNYQSHSPQLIVPTGLIDLLNAAKQVCHPDSVLFFSEYFTRHGGGELVPLPGHYESLLNLNMTADLIRAMDFDVQVRPLIDCLNMNLNVETVGKDSLRFLYEKMRLLPSRTIPLRVRDFHLTVPGFPAPVARAEWLQFFSSYYVLLLRPRRPLSEMISLSDVPIRSKIFPVLRTSKEKKFLLNTYPSRAFPISKNIYALLRQIDGRQDLSQILMKLKKRGVRMNAVRLMQNLIQLQKIGFIYFQDKP